MQTRDIGALGDFEAGWRSRRVLKRYGIETDGDLSGDFVAWYVKDDQVRAAFGHGCADTLSRLERTIARSGPVPASHWIG